MQTSSGLQVLFDAISVQHIGSIQRIAADAHFGTAAAEAQLKLQNVCKLSVKRDCRRSVLYVECCSGQFNAATDIVAGGRTGSRIAHTRKVNFECSTTTNFCGGGSGGGSGGGRRRRSSSHVYPSHIQWWSAITGFLR
jgi:hypothetical protein